MDGETARITPAGDAMIAVHLEPGLHAISLDYEAPGFSLGLRISVVCLAAFLVFLILALLSRFSNPPIVRVPVALADPREEEAGSDPDAPPAAEPMPPSASAAAPTRSSASTMPRLDLTRAWDAPAAADKPAPPQEDASPVRPEADGPADREDPAQPGRRTLTTTGMFDPNKLSRADEEGRGASFEALKHLERLEKLLEQSDPGSDR